MDEPPRLRLLSLGAGVQSTTLLLMSAWGELPKLDHAIFADTMGEPGYVYRQLGVVSREAARHGIQVHLVSQGNLAAQLVSGTGRFASIPYYTLSPEGKRGIGRRQCTNEFKIRPIHRMARQLMGLPARGRVTNGVWAEQWIGFSADEIMRVSDRHRLQYLRPRYPLLELGMSRADCLDWLAAQGWEDVAKSACVFCPFHGDDAWIDMRDNRPEDWRRACEVDEAIRRGGQGGTSSLDGQAFLHPSRMPLAIAPVGARQNTGNYRGCSPYGCRTW